jgi:hypothetical protein
MRQNRITHQVKTGRGANTYKRDKSDEGPGGGAWSRRS